MFRAARRIQWAFLVVQKVKRLPTMRETWVQSLGQEDPLEKGNGNPFQYSLDRGAWRAIVHGVAKSWTQLSDYESESHAVVSDSL